MNFVRTSPPRGAGIGSIFGTLFRTVSPIVKKLFGTGGRILRSQAARSLAKDIRRDAVQSGLKLASQALSGENIAKAAKQNVKEFGKRAANRTGSAISKAVENKSAVSAPAARRNKRVRRRKNMNKTTGRKKVKYAPEATKSGRTSDIFDTATGDDS